MTGARVPGEARRDRAAEVAGAPAGSASAKVPETLAELMALAVHLEREAAGRYVELADAMETHNNPDVAELFHRMATIELGHAQSILSTMGWREAPPAAPTLLQSPEASPSDSLHYLMQPWHALEIALDCELRAERFFARLVQNVDTDELREAALVLHREEQSHVELIRAWMERVERPRPGWSEDPDPPRYTD